MEENHDAKHNLDQIKINGGKFLFLHWTILEKNKKCETTLCFNSEIYEDLIIYVNY